MDLKLNICDRAYHSVLAANLLLDYYISTYFRWDLTPAQKLDADELMRLLSCELDTSRAALAQLMENAP